MPETFEPLLYANNCLQCLQQAFLTPAPSFSIVKYSQTIDFFFLFLVGCCVSLSFNGVSKYSGGISMLTSALLSIGVISMSTVMVEVGGNTDHNR